MSLLRIFTAAVALFAAATAKADTPNVIIVLADDLGIGDLSATNPDAKISTPHLSELASQGMTFLDAHTSSSVCTPTRYGLLTGRYNWRSRLAKGVLFGYDRHLIPAERPTIAHLLRDAGYHTAMIGKWHLGWDWHRNNESTPQDIDFAEPVVNGPDINGFDQYYAHCGSLDMPPYVWVDSGRCTAIPTRSEGVSRQESAYGWYREGPIAPDFVIDDVLPHLFDQSIQYVRERSTAEKREQPFFLYLPLPAPHTPIVPIAPFKDASGINPYADFVMQVDHHMGQLLATLDEVKQADNTLVLFTSDNGCSPQANFDVLASHGHDPSAIYRGHKADIYEAGHRVPLIVRWPKRVAPSTTSKATVCLTDVYATLREILGEPLDNGGEDSFSMMPALAGADSTSRRTLISHSVEGRFAIRVGKWKLCLCRGSGGWSEPKEKKAERQNLPEKQLYDLISDPGETTNLIAKYPDVARELESTLTTKIRRGRSTPGANRSNDREVTF
ncbi:MAG: arylsulfatase [Planctomycetota bacterium]